jgi:hypothetical protein
MASHQLQRTHNQAQIQFEGCHPLNRPKGREAGVSQTACSCIVSTSRGTDTKHTRIIALLRKPAGSASAATANEETPLPTNRYLRFPKSPRICLRGCAGKAVESNSLTACSHFASARETAPAWVGAPEPFRNSAGPRLLCHDTSGTATLFCFAREASKKRPQPVGN